MYDWLLPAEVFREKDCPDDDVWPCTEAALNTPSFFPSQRRFVVWEEAKKEPKGTPTKEPDKGKVLQPISELRPLRQYAGRGDGARSSGAASATATVAAAAAVRSGGAGRPGRRSARLLGAPTGVTTPVAAQRAESCTAACARWKEGGRCSLEGLQLLNTCASMQQHFGCAEDACEDSEGADQPALVD